MRSGRRLLGLSFRFVLLLVIQGLVILALAAILPGVKTPSFAAAVLVAAAMALINALLWPLVIRVALPLTVFTFGLGSLVFSAGTVALGFYVVDGTRIPIGGDLAIAFAMALVSMLIAPLLDVDGDAQHLRVVRRRVRHGRRANRSDVPGVILFEIDGLGETILREAVRDGHVPTIARWLADGTHKVLGWECDLSSQTGASQAGLLLGSNWDMPAFRWYEKESGRTLVSNHPADAAEIERRRSSGAGLLAAGGTSRGNMFSGDAPRCTATMSVIRDRTRSKSGDFFAYFSDPYGFLRTICLSLADIAYERRAARRQRRSGAEHVDRGGAYPLIRAAIAVVMRDLNVALLMADIVEGVPVSYATFVGYDEVAHHSGIREPDALAVLKRHDRQLERLERAVAQAPRPYHLVVLSDHGQTQGAPFRARYGITLEQLVDGALARGEAHAPAAVDEAWGDVGAVLADARQDPGLGGRALARATRGRAVEGTVALGPNQEALAERAAPSEPRLRAGGDRDGLRPARPDLPAAQPRAADARADLRGAPRAARHAHHASRDRLRDGALRRAGRGRDRRRAADAGSPDDAVEGEDPLADFGPHVADHLRRHDSFPHCPDILVNSMYDPAADEVAPFEEFMGSHGGLGGPQMHPFAVVPAEWREPAAPIVGVEAMHEALRDWLAQPHEPRNEARSPSRRLTRGARAREARSPSRR